ncbi:MAG: glutamate 5-kinase [Sulfurovum sp.]|nr:glutamate 5-kinase [Sulfurovum sp.]
MKRVVLKVGSHVLTENGGMANDRINALIELIAQIKSKGTEVILVSSGAVATGYTQLQLDRASVSNRQALAAIGQPFLLSMYQNFFSKHDILCSQVLLSADVFDSRKHTKHAKMAIDTLLENGVVPIINENDTVSIDELVFGDNDRLSAHVAYYFDAELLVLLSDIDAYYDKDPNKHGDAKAKKIVVNISDDELNATATPSDKFATGGIVTKLQAADFLMRHDREMFLASGFDLNDVKDFLIKGEHVGGTLFKS